MNDGYIRTWSGRKFWPLRPRAEDICLEDIAHGCAYENRWSGHARIPINVAWHSNRVRDFALAIAPAHLRIQAALYAQLHDAHEAYIRDIPATIKGLMPEYIKATNEIDAIIFKVFGLPPEMPDEIAEIVGTCDHWAARVEAEAWTSLRHSEQDLLPEPPRELLLLIDVDAPPSPEEDKAEFIDAAKVLGRLIYT